MISALIPDILAISLFIVTFFVSLRALYLYLRVRTPRLFNLALAMFVLALTAAADFASGYITTIHLNTDWFLYVGQAISFSFILLSLFNISADYSRRLIAWHTAISALVFLLLLAAPVLPEFPNLIIKTLLSSSRCAICFAIFFYYVSAFMSKQARFSLLMGLSFLLLSFGYLVIFMQYFVNGGVFLDNVGDIIRVVALIVLFAAVIAG